MNVLIDCGAYTGDSLPVLIRRFGPFERILCFEASPELSLVPPPDLSIPVEIHRLAVWIADGEQILFFGEHAEGSTLLHNKTSGNLSVARSTRVPTIDFAAWLLHNTEPHDQLIIKMDIEGAEFPVLQRLVGHPVRRRIRQLWVEWHHNRLRPAWRYRIWRRLLELRYLLIGLPIGNWRRKSMGLSAPDQVDSLQE